MPEPGHRKDDIMDRMVIHQDIVERDLELDLGDPDPAESMPPTTMPSGCSETYGECSPASP